MTELTCHYSHLQHGRSIGSILGLMVFAGLTGYVIAWNSPWHYLLIPIAGMGGLGWLVLGNPKSGCSINSETFHFFAGSEERKLAMGDIVKVRIIDWTDGRPSAVVVMRDGEEHFVHSTCFKDTEKLGAAFAAAGIACER